MLHFEIPWDELQTVTLPTLIPRATISRAHRQLLDLEETLDGVKSELAKHYGQAAHLLNDLFTWDDETSPWRFWKTEDQAPVWTRRFAKEYKDKFGTVLPKEISSWLGESLRRSIPSRTPYYFAFTKFTNWKHGSFEPEGAGTCWWNAGAHQSARLGLPLLEGGGAVLFYSGPESFKEFHKQSGLARCWIIVDDEKAVIFNGYTKRNANPITLEHMAQVLSIFWGAPQKRVTLYSHDTYINANGHNNAGRDGGSRGLGYCISREDYSSTVEIPELKIAKCEKCGVIAPIRDFRRVGHSDEVICPTCARDYQECSRCGNLHPSYNLRTFSDDLHLCPLCEDSVVICDRCGPTIRDLLPVSTPNGIKQICPVCLYKTSYDNCGLCGVRTIPGIHVRVNQKVHVCICHECGDAIKEHLINHPNGLRIPEPEERWVSWDPAAVYIHHAGPGKL